MQLLPDIRTYSVVSLNEECGLIQWVPNTIPVRTILSTHYLRRGRQLWVSDFGRKDLLCPDMFVAQTGELRAGFDKVKAIANHREAAEVFVREVLSLYASCYVSNGAGHSPAWTRKVPSRHARMVYRNVPGAYILAHKSDGL